MTPFASCSEIVRALRAREISASQWLEIQLDRIDRFDQPLNSIIARCDDRARSDAAAIDSLIASGDEQAIAAKPLLGVPITVKESVDVVGMASTAGVEWRKDHRAAADARNVTRLRDAGAIVIGKTNVCPYLADYIADNPVYGRTVSPWDATRTPGGSSGGSASLAAGFGALDLGSDLGGSIRIPAAFCGLYGHKPSEGAVPNSGHFPGSTLPNAGWLMSAQGPLARSADDLARALNVLAGPDLGMDAAWRLHLPPPRHSNESIQSFRVAALPWFDWMPLDAEIVSPFDRLLDRLRGAGVAVTIATPPTLGDYQDYYRLTRMVMSSLVSARWPAEQRQKVADDRRRRGSISHAADASGFSASASDFLLWHEKRENYRQAYRELFANFDVMLTPISLVPPFPHPTQPVVDRQFDIGGTMVDFDCLSFYPGVASLCGHGATAFPIGFTASGLPLGAQAIGPFLEDFTAIAFASAVEKAFGGFVPPPAYQGEYQGDVAK